jgi:hypothetical protein
MVELHVRRATLAMPRATTDVDVGVHKRDLQDGRIVAELHRRNYERSAGHIFRRAGGDSVGVPSVDILVPAYLTRQSREVTIGVITTIEVGMLSEAITSVVPTPVEVVTTDGASRNLVVPLPSLERALDLKLGAWDARRATKDAYDVWRCLEALARTTAASSSPVAGCEIDHPDFVGIDGAGVHAAVAYQGLSGDAAIQAAARIVSLVRLLNVRR